MQNRLESEINKNAVVPDSVKVPAKKDMINLYGKDSTEELEKEIEK